jgi:hypothetical protein
MVSKVKNKKPDPKNNLEKRKTITPRKSVVKEPAQSKSMIMSQKRMSTINKSFNKSKTNTSNVRSKSKSVISIKTERKSVVANKKKSIIRKKSEVGNILDSSMLKESQEDKDKETQLIIDSLKYFNEQYNKITEKKNEVEFSPFDVEEERKYINMVNQENRRNKEMETTKKEMLSIIDNIIDKVFEKLYNNPIMSQSFIGIFMKSRNNFDDEEDENILDFKKPTKILESETKSMTSKKPVTQYDNKSKIRKDSKIFHTANNFNCSFNLEVKKKSSDFKSMILPPNYGRHNTIITNDLNLNNSVDDKIQKYLTQSVISKPKNINIINLQNYNLNTKNSLGELRETVINLFKKILIYSTKLEELKNELFTNNPDFNLFGIFKIYDEDDDGFLLNQQFEKLIIDIGFQLSGLQLDRLMCYLNNFLTKSKEKINIDNINFTNFTKLFFPSNKDSSQIFHNLYKGSTKARKHDDLVIKESEFHLMRQIVIIMLRKLDDISSLVQSLKSSDIDEAFKIVSMSKNVITWDCLTSFLENSGIKFIDEDLEHIFMNFRTKQFTTISYETFIDFLNHPIWNIKK